MFSAGKKEFLHQGVLLRLLTNEKSPLEGGFGRTNKSGTKEKIL